MKLLWALASPLLHIAFLSTGGCADTGGPAETRPVFSFEEGMDGWTAAAADTGVPGEAYAPWSIGRSTELAYDGEYALKFYVENNTDAAKIWIVRPFSVTPGRSYDIEVSFAFGTRDFGINPWVLLTGVFRSPPTDGTSLLSGAEQEHTGNGSDSDAGYLWFRKNFHTSLSVAGTARLYVVVGVWGTWEAPRTYFVDDLTVEATPD